jgi:hypothetical protein
MEWVDAKKKRHHEGGQHSAFEHPNQPEDQQTIHEVKDQVCEMVGKGVELKESIFQRVREEGQRVVMSHIDTIKNGFDVSPGPLHNHFIFNYILLIIPVEKIIF